MKKGEGGQRKVKSTPLPPKNGPKTAEIDVSKLLKKVMILMPVFDIRLYVYKLA